MNITRQNSVGDHFTRRQFLGLLASSSAGTALLAACIAPVGSPTAPTTAPAVQSSTGQMPADMAVEQVLRFAAPRTLDNLDPSQEGGYGRFIVQNVWLPPFVANFDLNLMPGTCTRYEVSDDGLTYTLHINPAVKWSDGSQFTAADIKAWFEFVVRIDNPAGYIKADYRDIQGFQAVQEGTTTELEGVAVFDDQTLQITLSQPNPIFHYLALATQNMATAKADFARQNPTDWWLKAPLVTGPYKIESFDSDLGQFTFVPNPNYWGEPKPIIQKVEMVAVKDEATISIMFENDEIDVGHMLSEVGDQLAAQYPESVIPENYMFSVYWLLNPSIPPTDDPMVRRALIHAIDFREVVKVVYGDTKPPAPGPITPITLGYQADVDQKHDTFKFDPELARQELAQSTYGSADKLPTLHLAAGTPQSDLVRGMEIIMEMWRENLGITNVETKFWWADWPKDDKGIRDVNLGGMLMAAFPDSATVMQMFSDPGGVLARVGYNNSELVDLVSEAFPIPRDDPKYVEMVQQAQLMFLSDYIYKPYYLTQYFYLAKPWVKNMKANWYNSWYNLSEVYIAKH